MTEKHPIFDKQDIIYGFISNCSATLPDKFIGECIGDIIIAIQKYEDYISKLDE